MAVSMQGPADVNELLRAQRLGLAPALERRKTLGLFFSPKQKSSAFQARIEEGRLYFLDNQLPRSLLCVANKPRIK